MSDLTPPSFCDDGLEFNTRTPHPRGPSITQWLDSVNDSASTVTTYLDTASYVDDGADPNLYEDVNHKDDQGGRGKSKAKANEKPEKYHPDVQRAVSGQVQNVLRSMWAVSRVHVRDPAEKAKGKDGEGTKAEKPPPGAVRVQVPGPPPTFVIHGDMGHVVVVDGLEEPIDSKPVGGLEVSAEKVGEWLQGDRKRVRQKSDRKIRGQQMHTQQSEKIEAPQTWNKQGDTRTRHQDSAYRRQAEELDWSTDSDSDVTSQPGFFLDDSRGASLTRSEDVWADSWEGGTEVTRSNHQAPTVEDVADSECEYSSYILRCTLHANGRE
jgi:hypothetical protein